MKYLAFVLAFACLPFAACTSSIGGNGGSGGTAACATDADCGSNRVCGFPESDGCAAKGQCFAAPGVVCQAYSAGCACDGTEINVACTGLPSGFVAKPLAHAGACVDACTASYPCLSTVACAADTDCATLGSGCDACMKMCGCASAGSGCCPAGWGLYACTYPDGGAGFACHNPQMGCASSTTCGEGCDAIVTGACDGG
jgi:hypothetical protein